MSYRLHGAWREHDTVGPIDVEVADLIDSRGNVFPDGAYRVSKGKVRKLFKGETAWSDAARFANDLYYKWRLER